MLFADDIIQHGEWWWGERKETKVDEIYYYYYYDWPNESGLSSFRRSIRRRRSPLSLPLTTLLYLFCSCCCTATGKLCLLPVDVVGRSPWPNSQTTCLFNYSVLIECIQEKIKMQWRKINANNILFIVFIQCHQSPSSIGDVFTVSHSRMKLIQWPQDKVSGTL